MPCPHLKEVVMLFCDACPVRKMLPLDRIVTADPCLGDYQKCLLFQEVTARLMVARDAAPADRTVAGRKEGSR